MSENSSFGTDDVRQAARDARLAKPHYWDLAGDRGS